MRTVFAALVAALLALPPHADVHGQEAPTFSASSELVVLHVTVRDKKGAYVAGLEQSAFNVIEDGRAQTVSHFTDADTPATIGLLIDSSGTRVGYYRYSPWGAVTLLDDVNGAASNNPWRYLGAYGDPSRGGADGYTHLSARYYDNHSHFSQPDAEPGNLSNPQSTLSYSYTSSDPINRSDATGDSWQDLLGLASDIGQVFYYAYTGDYEAAWDQGAAIISGIGFEGVCTAVVGLETAGAGAVGCYVLGSVVSSGYFNYLQST